MASQLVVTGGGPNVTGGLREPQFSDDWGQLIVVNGELIFDFDEPYFFTNGSILSLGPDASIVVRTNTLTLNEQTVIEGCTDMWDAITVEDGATLYVDGSPVNNASQIIKIEDGIDGIVVEDGGTLISELCEYRNNRVSIQATTSSGSLIEPNFAINNNEFYSDELKAPFAGQSAYTGILVERMSNSILLKNNTYRDMDNGIVGYATSVLINFDYFENLDIGINVTGGGYNRTLMEIGKGVGGSSPATFLNCRNGIVADRMNVYAQQNNMEGMRKGVVLRNGLFRNFDITTNIIEAELTGVSINYWYPSSSGEVEYNEITINGNETEGTAIFAENFWVNTNLDRIGRFKDNDITLRDANFGIRINGCRKIVMDENDVTFGNASTYDAGFLVQDSEQNRLFCNYVEGTDITNFQNAYVLDQGPENFFGCNSADEVRIGLNFVGPNLSTTIEGHDFYTHQSALMGGKDGLPFGFTGVQEHNGNRWTETYSGGNVGYRHWSSSFDDLDNSVHVYDENDNGAGNLETNTYPLSANLFEDEVGDTYTCASETTGCPPDTDNFGGEIGDTDKAIAGGNLTSAVFGDEQTWTAKRQLYRKLLREPSLVVPNTVIDTFFDTERSTTVGEFESMRADIEGLFNIDSLTMDSMSVDDSLLQVYYVELLDIDLELDTASTQQLQDSLQLLKDNKSAQIDSLAGLQTDRDVRLETSRASSASSLLTDNGNISTTYTYEDNQLDYNDVFLRIIADGQDTLTTAQVTTLTSIADQCPYEGGEAVFQARALLGNGAVYDDVARCDTSSVPLIRPKTKQSLTFIVSPNPSSYFINVVLDEKAASDGRLILMNTYGTILKQQDVREGDQALILFMDDIPSGTYYLTVETESGRETQIISNMK